MQVISSPRMIGFLFAPLAVLLIALAGKGASEDRRAGKDGELAPKSSTDAGKRPTALAIFERRILPIFRAKEPSSCVECHLSGVDLKDYIHPEQDRTFAALVRAGMVNVDKPRDSKILEFIARKPKKPGLISEGIRTQEYDAFRAWLEAAVKEPSLLAARPGDERLGPTVPDAVIRHARKDRVLASFVDNVWAEVGRCAHCHSPDHNQEQVQKHGKRVSWIKLGDPEATMTYMLDKGLIDPDAPEESLLLTKPTMQVKHGGGQKMVVGDRAYKRFRHFLEDYAAIVSEKYTTAGQLPEQDREVSATSEVWLKVEGVPARFDAMLLQADVYRREGNGWSKERWASADRQIHGQGELWQSTLSLTAPRGSERAEEIRRKPTLPPGRYLVRLYVDQKGDLGRDYRREMGKEQFVGEVEVESQWPEDYGSMTVVQFPRR
ncbi:MAG: hypothetical protein NVSMB9_10220 [Isosphaeraceae bacterium]